jgi:hypothetical protein
MKTEFNENENQSHREELISRDFKGVWTPREIWLNKELSIWAKQLWAEIHSLYDREKGGCFASDEYLCEFLNLKKSRLHEVLKELRDANLLERVAFDGRKRLLRAIVPETDYGPNASATVESRLPESRKAVFRNPGNYPLYSKKKEKKEGGGGKPPPARPPSSVSKKSKPKKKPPEPKKAYGEHQIVELTDAEHAKLVKKFGQEQTDRWIKKMDLYFVNNSKKAEKTNSFYATALKWAMADEEETSRNFGNARNGVSKLRCFETTKDGYVPPNPLEKYMTEEDG